MKKFAFLLYFIFGASILNAQTCGFSCLGLSGFFAGYSLVEYDAQNFNHYVASSIDMDNLTGDVPNFKRAEGYRFGANIFRAQFDDYFVSAKGFYQISNQEQEFQQISSDINRVDKYSVKLNYWGLGIDFGIPIFSFLDLKLLEGGITFFDVDVVHSRKENSQNISEVKYESAKVDLSYYIASGLIIHIIPNYISLEGTASYNIFQVDQLEDENGNPFSPLAKGESLFSGKKISATIQLNIGIPF